MRCFLPLYLCVCQMHRVMRIWKSIIGVYTYSLSYRVLFCFLTYENHLLWAYCVSISVSEYQGWGGGNVSWSLKTIEALICLCCSRLSAANLLTVPKADLRKLVLRMHSGTFKTSHLLTSEQLQLCLHSKADLKVYI